MAKIVVGFDSSASERLADAAARLAQALEGELLGIFVEEPAALRLAELPFTLLIEHSGRAQALDLAHLEALFAAAAERASAELARAARRERVPVSFRVARGRLLRELASAANERDLIVMDSSRPEPRPGASRGPVTLAATRAEHVRTLLELGAAVAGRELLVLIAPEDARPGAERWAAETGHPVLFRRFASFAPRGLGRAVAQLSGRMLLVVGDEWGERELGELRRELGCPLVLCR